MPSVSEHDQSSSPRIDYVLSVASPWTYLGHARFCRIARQFRATVRILPVDMVEVFARTGGTVFRNRAPERQSYRQIELERWSQALNIPLTLEPRYYPVAHEPASRLILAASDMGYDALALTGRLLAAIWLEERNIADKTTLHAIAAEGDVNTEALFRHAASADVGKAYEAATLEAVAKGAFGAPTYILGGERFWGQDRLNFVEKSLLSMTEVSSTISSE
ncbi:2-hydroxychromene-2-carboxylate isomerase [Aurantimonas sp. A3-2-R12]|uniref:2-hydroxychromene-2-carboxylate isomerase n=1 Tax=Aurantimonas sp. A3-2-R12 TaxID=3114362 RepID=UPI002E171547|nr:2-hydroxychromene-2-carboxylate isomerase [Aurantimonas sp. A3-2-R12]